MKDKKNKAGVGWQRLFAATSLIGAGLILLLRPTSAHAAGREAMSSRAKTLVIERWNTASFTEGIAIIADPNETPTSRAAAMQMLHANRKKLTPSESREFLREATRLAKDDSLDETNSAIAVSVMANLALTMSEQGELSEAELKQEAGFLVMTATDSQRSIQLRGSAIAALGLLRVTEARDALRGLLSDSACRDVPEIARPACLSLMRIDGEHAIPDLANILKRTSNAGVFGTAAFALGQVKKPESVVALVENLSRFPDSGSCDAALVEMEEEICGILKDPQDERLSAGIQATRYLWREGQRETYAPLLRTLLSHAHLAARKAAAERLLESAGCLDFDNEKQELALVLKAISNQPELEEYQTQIRSRLSASVLMPNTNSAAAPAPVLKGIIK